MSKGWFKGLGWIYMPVSWQGYLVTLAILLFCLKVFIAVDSKSHSVSDTMYGIFPFIVPSLGILFWVA